MKKNLILIIICILIFSFSCKKESHIAKSAVKPYNVTKGIYNLSMIMDEYTIKSNEINDNVKIDISYLKSNYKKDNVIPVYITDGYWRRIDHKYIHDMSRLNIIPPVIVIGIGYPAGYDTGTIRKRDLYNMPEKFNKCIKNEVIPFVENKFSCNTEKRILFGASLGGAFTISSFLLNTQINDDTFLSYIGSSAWLHNTNHYELAYDIIRSKKPASFNLYLSYGSLEGENEFKIPNKDMFLIIKKIKRKLNFIHNEYPGKDHYTNTRVALVDGIKMFYGNEEYSGTGFSDISNSQMIYDFSHSVEVYDWFYYNLIEYLAFEKLIFDADSTDNNGEKGSLKVLCNFSNDKKQAGSISTNFDHIEDFTDKTITIDIYIPEEIANQNYNLQFYIQSTPEFWNWIVDKSPSIPVKKAGWNHYSFTWNQANLKNMKGNLSHTREVGLIIKKGKNDPDWSGYIYFDNFIW